MRIPVRDINALMTDPVRNSLCRDPHIDQQADMAVPQVMDPDPFNACRFRPPVHFMMKIVFCNFENPAVRLDAIETVNIVTHLIHQK